MKTNGAGILAVWIIAACCGGLAFSEINGSHAGGGPAGQIKLPNLPDDVFAHHGLAPLPGDVFAPKGLRCSKMVDKFCDDLYSKEHRGNLDLPFGHGVIPLRDGFSEK